MKPDLRNSFPIAIALSLLLICGCFSGQFFRGSDDLISMTLSPANASIQVGSSEQFSSSGTFGDYSTADVTARTTWSSSDPSIATIDAGGLATGISFGTVKITGTSTPYTLNATLTVSSSGKSLSSLAVTPSSVSIAVGETQQFTATGTYSDGSTTVITNAVTWSSSNPSTATITSTGQASATAAGTTVISATSANIIARATLVAQ